MVFDRQVVTQSPNETAKLGKELGNYLKNQGKGKTAQRIICLYGALGSGKTTFVQGLAHSLGIKTRLLSSTFIIVRRYSIGRKFVWFYHLDLFRIKGSQALVSLGLAEIFAEPKSLIIIEWADRLGEFLPEKRIEIHFESLRDGRHVLKFKTITKT